MFVSMHIINYWSLISSFQNFFLFLSNVSFVVITVNNPYIPYLSNKSFIGRLPISLFYLSVPLSIQNYSYRKSHNFPFSWNQCKWLIKLDISLPTVHLHSAEEINVTTLLSLAQSLHTYPIYKCSWSLLFFLLLKHSQISQSHQTPAIKQLLSLLICKLLK